MEDLFKNLKFKYTWRSYQAELLKNFSLHIADNHFHVIAPPGSGKTLLGLEIVQRLHKKALILSPTLTIRNQWENRLQTFFTDDVTYENISFDIKKPSDITFSTYQSFHAFYKQFEDKDKFISFFKKHKIEVLVVDEAHHLKNTWWNSLNELKKHSNLIIVALTATPPYDSSKIEISKYFELCGEIDDEIAIPNLVKEGDLSPHQDFVYLSKPEGAEIDFIVTYRKKIGVFINELKTNTEFISFIKSHRFYKETENNLEELYANPEYFSAILVFLHTAGENISKNKLQVLGFNKGEKIEFPQLNYEWVEILFQNLLVNDRESLIAHESYLSTLEKKLKKLHVLSNNKVNLVGNDAIYKSLSQNPSKLTSIVSIIKSEQKTLGKALRAVILTDYIRKEFLNTSKKHLPLINKLGVLPIFQFLRIHLENKKVIAVLTGSLVVIHHSILEKFKQYHKVNKEIGKPLVVDSEFVSIPKSVNLVETITKLFEEGYIQVLIGTKSLLGEGWDAPSINSLVLASFVGSFVTSNQMRGRAIRKDQNVPNKTGNIWHLACLDPTIDNGGKDLETLTRRFDAFMGISNSRMVISNGIDRLGLPLVYRLEDIDGLNKDTIKDSESREDIILKWNKSISQGKRLTKELTYYQHGKNDFPKQKRIYLKDTVKYFIVELFFGTVLFLLQFILNNIQVIFSKGALYFTYALLSAFVFNFGIKTYDAFRIYIQYGLIHKKIKKMGEAVLDTLFELGYMTSSRENISIQSELLSKGDVICTVVGTTQYESTLFVNALEEVVKPIENPRYLIIVKSFFRRKMRLQNYYAVPTIFGSHKKDVVVFKKHWSKQMGRSKVFYTRQFKGRRLLLKARLYHISNAFKKLTKNSIIWK